MVGSSRTLGTGDRETAGGGREQAHLLLSLSLSLLLWFDRSVCRAAAGRAAGSMQNQSLAQRRHSVTASGWMVGRPFFSHRSH